MSEEFFKHLPSDWERVQRLGLLPGVTSAEEYARRVTLGMASAQAMLKTMGEVVPSEDTIRALHYTTFRLVHPWAGRFRTIGQEVQAGSLICSDAKDIRRELQEVTREMHRYPLKGTKKHLSEIIAYYHAAFIAIHPFLDGNGRVGRLMLDYQMQSLLGKTLDQQIPKKDYVKAIQKAAEYGDLKPLAEIIQAYGREISIDKRKLVVVASNTQVITKTLEQSEKDHTALLKKEKELLAQRRKLGFVGSDADALYGLGGFPKPMTENAALKQADESVPWFLTKDEALLMAREILARERAVEEQRRLVQESLIAVRSDLVRHARVDVGRGIGRKMGQGRK